MAKSTSTAAKQATLPHLVQTTGNHLSHTHRHALALEDSIKGEDGKFNFEHMITHLNGAIEHVQKIAEHLKDNYPAEGKELAALEKTVPRTDMVSSVVKKMAAIGQQNK